MGVTLIRLVGLVSVAVFWGWGAAKENGLVA